MNWQVQPAEERSFGRKRSAMAPDDRDLLAVLKTELEFLQSGRYRHVARAPWRVPLYFQDSPSCPRLARLGTGEQPCSGCVLFPLVPFFAQDEPLPCRHIPLTAEGHTLHILYGCATPFEIRRAFERWLRATILRLETKRALFQEGWIYRQLSA